MAQLEAPVRFIWTTNGRVRRVDEPITPERLEAIARLLERASEAFNHKGPAPGQGACGKLK